MSKRDINRVESALVQTNSASIGVDHTTDEVRNINSRRILGNSELCAQFIRDHIKIPELANVRPEDIEDVSERYQVYLGIEFEADTVKKIHLRNVSMEEDGTARWKDTPDADSVYLISLMEHKSRVDYDVAMQLLRYIVCIWDDYAREMEKKHEGITKQKRFRYPPILPIVYYEGKARWSADMRLSDRIKMSRSLGKYMPDFTYQVVRIHDYSNEELIQRGDALSLIMMINKIQSPEDFTHFLQSPPKQLDEILKNAEGNIRDIIKEVMYGLLMKMRVPVGEAKQYIELIEECRMGYLFENMEEMDIQEERRKTAAARQELEAVRRKIIEAQEEAEKERQKLVRAREEVEEAENAREEAENAREEAENAREEAENAREEAENAREEAENAREEAENAREEAENAREEAENALKKLIRAMVYDEQGNGPASVYSVDKLAETCNLSREEAAELIRRIERED